MRLGFKGLGRRGWSPSLGFRVLRSLRLMEDVLLP